GSSETFTYDSAGNRLTATDGEGRTTTWTYDGRGQWLTMTDPAGGVTTRETNAFAEVTSEETDAGDETVFGRDTYGRVTSADLPDGASRSFNYDLCDRRTSFEDGNGETATWEYDANGNLVNYTDNEQYQVGYGWDLMDRPVSLSDDESRVSSVTYDEMGRFATKTDREGATWTNQWDDTERLTAVTDPAGGVWRSTYDDAGRLVESIDPAGRTLAWERTPEGLVSAMTTPEGRRTSFAYDSRQRPTLIVDGAGRTTELGWDDSSRMVSSDLGGGLVRAEYLMDDGGRLAGIVDPNEETWTYTRDEAGRPVTRVDPLGNTTTWTWDERDRPSLFTFPGGLGTVQLTYDDENAVVRRQYSDGTDLQFTHDALGLRVTGPSMNFVYNSSRVMTRCNGMDIGRDDEGRMTSLEIRTGNTVNYTLNALGQVTRVRDWNGGGVDITWDSAGRPVSVARTNGVTTTTEYDDDNRPISITHGSLGSITMQRDGGGLVTQSVRDLPGAPSLDDITDGVFTYDAASQMVGLTHDALGRVTADGARTYDWNLASRLESVTRPAGAVAWTYDGVGFPVSRATEDTVQWTWCHAFDQPTPVLEMDGGTPLRAWVCLPDGTPLYGVDLATGDRWFLHYDESGNTVFLTDDSGTVTDTFGWSPYGTLLSRTGTTPAIFTWQGRHGCIDEGDGLFRMRARMYDANHSRFLRRDPETGQTDPRLVNPYVFAAADPVNLADPWGETPQDTSGDTSDLRTGLGMAFNAAGGVTEGMQVNNPNIGRVGWTRGGEQLARNAKAAGGVATVAGAGLEVWNCNERMDYASERFRNRNQQILDHYYRLRSMAWHLYSIKRQITYEQYRAMVDALREARDFNLQNSEDSFTTDSLANGTITTLNLLTNLIPGGGLVVDWSDHIQH
ncbi:MAG: RHS repeat domain-containing protein, partial [Planctomycetota bacterium]